MCAVVEARSAEAAEARAALQMREEEAVALRARADATQAEVAALAEKVGLLLSGRCAWL